jgi:hypothetical protein
MSRHEVPGKMTILWIQGCLRPSMSNPLLRLPFHQHSAKFVARYWVLLTSVYFCPDLYVETSGKIYDLPLNSQYQLQKFYRTKTAAFS